MPIEDRRVRRTRGILSDALVALILEKGYEKITVQDILDRADIGRSTFYAHFRDKDALLFANFDELRRDLRRDIDAMMPGNAPGDPARPTVVIFEHADRHRRIYRAMCGRPGGTLVSRHLHAMVGELLRDHLRPLLAGTDLDVDFVAEFYSNAALGVLTWWVNQDFPYSPRQVATMYQTLATPGILAAVRVPAAAAAGR